MKTNKPKLKNTNIQHSNKSTLTMNAAQDIKTLNMYF